MTWRLAREGRKPNPWDIEIALSLESLFATVDLAKAGGCPKSLGDRCEAYLLRLPGTRHRAGCGSIKEGVNTGDLPSTTLDQHGFLAFVILEALRRTQGPASESTNIPVR